MSADIGSVIFADYPVSGRGGSLTVIGSRLVADENPVDVFCDRPRDRSVADENPVRGRGKRRNGDQAIPVGDLPGQGALDGNAVEEVADLLRSCVHLIAEPQSGSSRQAVIAPEQSPGYRLVKMIVNVVPGAPYIAELRPEGGIPVS